MTATYLKSAPQPAAIHDASTAETVSDMLTDIEAGGEDAVRRYSASLDGWSPDSFMLSRNDIENAADAVPAGETGALPDARTLPKPVLNGSRAR